MALKQGPKQDPQLPIRFGQTVTRAQYDNLSKDRWFAYFAVGAVEAFHDSETEVASLASHLEGYDKAGVSGLLLAHAGY